MIDPSIAIATITTAIDEANAAFAAVDGASAPERATILEARATLATLIAARDAYVDQWVIAPLRGGTTLTETKNSHGVTVVWNYVTTPRSPDYDPDPLGKWAKTYKPAFESLESHANYCIDAFSYPHAEPVPYDYAPDQAKHDLLATKSVTAGLVTGPPDDSRDRALGELASHRVAFDAAWARNPLFSIPIEADTSTTGLALTAAIAATAPVVEFLTWAKDNP